ncbi:hypothetical protein HMSSN036_23710 [Paenibacillus macerans]|nr:hypothetical protein HMSSN036_23710 [Paenibacillus macerans]
MNPLSLNMKTKIMFGAGIIQQLSGQILPNIKNILIVTGKYSAERYGHLTLVCDELNKANAIPFVFNKISPNPTVIEIDAGVEFAKKIRLN